MAKKVETSSGKSINSNIDSLPDEVLGEILCLVPTKVAASTSILSKRWRNLLPLVRNLDFDESMVFYPKRRSATSGGFLDFVERTLVLVGDSDSPMKKFSMKWESEMDKSRYQHLIRSVLERGPLEVHLSSSSLQYIEPDFFFSKTLVKLTLTHGYYSQDRYPRAGAVFFPALKTVSLFDVSYAAFCGADLYDSFLYCCPVLEEFNLRVGDVDAPGPGCWIKYVWGSSIQRLSIFYRADDDYLDCHSSVVIKTPSLVYLDYSSYVCEEYDLQLDSLVEARLDLILWKHNTYDLPPVDDYYKYDSTKGDAWGDATQLIEAISNVVTLHLSADSLEVFYFCCKSLPEFNNLATLSFESHQERDWQVLPLLLNKSPNLETLVIKGLVHKIAKGCGDVCVCKRLQTNKMKKIGSCLLSCRVKVLEIHGYGGSSREFKQMRHFMKNLRCLEVVKVKVQVDQQDQDYNYSSLAHDLINLASSKCKIQFI